MSSITAGSTNVSLYVYFVDDDGGTAPGEPTTGLLFSNIETGGSASYVRQGAARSDFELVTLANASAAHSDGGFILVDDTNMPGLYRVDLPDAAFASGVDFVIIQLVAAAANNTLMRPLLVMLPVFDLGTAAATMRGTDNAALATVCTEARLAELDAANLITDVANVKTDTAEIGTAGAGLTNINLPNQTMDITGDLSGSVGSVTARVTANTDQIAGVASAATQLSLSADAIIGLGTASGTPTTTTMISDIGVTVDNQYNGRIIIFADDTTTAGLRDAATDITSCTAATNTLTFTALPATPVSGDTFVIV